MLKESGLDRNAEDSSSSEERSAFSVFNNSPEMCCCTRFVRIKRTEEHNTEAVTASQARINCSSAMARLITAFTSSYANPYFSRKM
jgi:hypothetical protein